MPWAVPYRRCYRAAVQLLRTRPPAHATWRAGRRAAPCHKRRRRSRARSAAQKLATDRSVEQKEHKYNSVYTQDNATLQVLQHTKQTQETRRRARSGPHACSAPLKTDTPQAAFGAIRRGARPAALHSLRARPAKRDAQWAHVSPTELNLTWWQHINRSNFPPDRTPCPCAAQLLLHSCVPATSCARC